MAKCLMLGLGSVKPTRRITVMGGEPEWTTLDIDPDLKPDIVFDLNNLRHEHHIPIGREAFGEIHSYSTLDQHGVQGDFMGWFREFGEYHRILKPGGLFCCIVAASNGPYTWADPGCKRVIHSVNVKYLTKDFYKLLGENGPGLTDYRKYVQGWWRLVYAQNKDGAFTFILQKGE